MDLKAKAFSNPTQRERLKKLRELCKTLPEVKISGARHLVFRIGRKTFAWYLNNHHGDGIVSLCAKSTRPRQQALVSANPERYYVPAYVGHQGWVGLRLDRRDVRWDEALDLLVAAYRAQAPRRLAKQFE